jgi:hypothetical protein
MYGVLLPGGAEHRILTTLHNLAQWKSIYCQKPFIYCRNFSNSTCLWFTDAACGTKRIYFSQTGLRIPSDGSAEGRESQVKDYKGPVDARIEVELYGCHCLTAIAMLEVGKLSLSLEFF